RRRADVPHLSAGHWRPPGRRVILGGAMKPLPQRVGAAAVLLLAAAVGRAQPIPTPDHVVIAVLENRTFGQVIGSPDAPYINGLVGQGALLTNSFAVTHPSQPNYLALYS